MYIGSMVSTTICRLRPFVFSSVNTAIFRSRSGFYALRVDDCIAWVGIASGNPHFFHQRRADLLPKPAFDCGVIKIGHGGIWWKIVWQVSPFAPVIHKVQYGIYQLSFFPLASVPSWREQWLDDCPLTVAPIAHIALPFIFLYHFSIVSLPALLVQLLNRFFLHSVSHQL